MKNNGIEWGFVTLLIALCALLTGLQYHWTGELSRAGAERLRANLGAGAAQLVRAFDRELSDDCNRLKPTGESPAEATGATASLARWRAWNATPHRPIFKRIAIAVRDRDGVQLSALDQNTGRLIPLPWPVEWSELRENLEDKDHGSPPYNDPLGALFEFPDFNRGPQAGGPPDDFGPPHDGGRRSGHDHPPGGPWVAEWMIFELDLNYLAKSWLPDLVHQYVNVTESPLNHVEVKTTLPPVRILYASSQPAGRSGEKAIVLPFNRQGRSMDLQGAPEGPAAWTLVVRPEEGVLEQLVAGERHRNLAVAFLLNGLLLAAGLALIHHTRRSRQLAETQMNFVATVSHELRTPLTVIRGAAHNLKRGVVQERGQIEKYSELIIQHAEQLGEMVEQVLQLAGVANRTAAVPRQTVLLPALLQDAMAATLHDTEAAHCEVQLTVPPGLPPVAGDPAALRRVFQNLIANAAKHGGEGGWIGITAACVVDGAPAMVEIHVADRGSGIPPGELPKIFAPFFRGALAQSRQTRGSGLGLSLVREIVSAHGGTISVGSQTGQGAVFTVRLPVAQS